MSGVGGPLPLSGDLLSVDDELAAFGGPVGDARAIEADLAIDAERAAIARRIGNIAAACQREAVEGMIPLSIVEMRLVTLSDDVRVGIHGVAR